LRPASPLTPLTSPSPPASPPVTARGFCAVFYRALGFFKTI